MAQVLIRDLDPEVVEALKKRAQENRRSLQGELKTILEAAASESQHKGLDLFLEQVQEIRRRTAERHHTDAAELVREDRAR
jgi:plasmid stability protein